MPLLNHISSTLNTHAQRVREGASHLHRRVGSLRNKPEVVVESNRSIDLLSTASSVGVAPTANAAVDEPAPAYSYDVAVRFIGASGLPALDIGGLSDPYIVANLDSRIEFK